MEKANVTLYTVIGDSNRIVEAIRERFEEMTKEFVCEDETSHPYRLAGRFPYHDQQSFQLER